MNVIGPQYPNLDSMQNLMVNFLMIDEKSKNKIEALKKENRFESLEFDATMFSQVWGSTCTAFDVTPNGEATIGGSAMTRAYTVVLHELTSNTFGIFVDGKPAYIITDANETFYEDLEKRNLKSLSEAMKKY